MSSEANDASVTPSSASSSASASASSSASSAGDDVAQPRQFVACVLGTMTFGWAGASSTCDEAKAAEMTKEFLGSHEQHTEIDTAFLYAGGETEAILGRIIPGVESTVGKKAELATKAGPWSKMISGAGGSYGSDAGAGGLSPKLLRLQLETSLKRLQVESVKLFYLHAPDVDTPLEETLLEVKKLHEEGKFQELGLSNYSAWETAHVWHLCDKLGVVKPTVYQGMYNGITRQVEVELFPCLRRLGLRFLAYNPLAGGLLTGKHRFDADPDVGRFKGNNLYLSRFWTKEYFAGLSKIQESCEAAGIPMSDAALRWMKFHSALDARHNDGIIIGASSMVHLAQNCTACDCQDPLPESVVAAFEEAWQITKPNCPKYFRP